ncbi:hypothetical protein EDD16DRAFT_1653101 [Pisolithus croceorrhizus]|nr:hypothetical protein EDD16DRAFT_1653101 [Pisolithus croceorrhizus]
MFLGLSILSHLACFMAKGSIVDNLVFLGSEKQRESREFSSTFSDIIYVLSLRCSQCEAPRLAPVEALYMHKGCPTETKRTSMQGQGQHKR